MDQRQGPSYELIANDGSVHSAAALTSENGSWRITVHPPLPVMQAVVVDSFPFSDAVRTSMTDIRSVHGFLGLQYNNLMESLKNVCSDTNGQTKVHLHDVLVSMAWPNCAGCQIGVVTQIKRIRKGGGINKRNRPITETSVEADDTWVQIRLLVRLKDTDKLMFRLNPNGSGSLLDVDKRVCFFRLGPIHSNSFARVQAVLKQNFPLVYHEVCARSPSDLFDIQKCIRPSNGAAFSDTVSNGSSVAVVPSVCRADSADVLDDSDKNIGGVSLDSASNGSSVAVVPSVCRADSADVLDDSDKNIGGVSLDSASNGSSVTVVYPDDEVSASTAEDASTAADAEDNCRRENGAGVTDKPQLLCFCGGVVSSLWTSSDQSEAIRPCLCPNRNVSPTFQFMDYTNAFNGASAVAVDCRFVADRNILSFDDIMKRVQLELEKEHKKWSSGATESVQVGLDLRFFRSFAHASLKDELRDTFCLAERLKITHLLLSLLEAEEKAWNRNATGKAEGSPVNPLATSTIVNKTEQRSVCGRGKKSVPKPKPYRPAKKHTACVCSKTQVPDGFGGLFGPNTRFATLCPELGAGQKSSELAKRALVTDQDKTSKRPKTTADIEQPPAVGFAEKMSSFETPLQALVRKQEKALMHANASGKSEPKNSIVQITICGDGSKGSEDVWISVRMTTGLQALVREVAKNVNPSLHFVCEFSTLRVMRFFMRDGTMYPFMQSFAYEDLVGKTVESTGIKDLDSLWLSFQSVAPLVREFWPNQDPPPAPMPVVQFDGTMTAVGNVHVSTGLRPSASFIDLCADDDEDDEDDEISPLEQFKLYLSGPAGVSGVLFVNAPMDCKVGELFQVAIVVAGDGERKALSDYNCRFMTYKNVHAWRKPEMQALGAQDMHTATPRSLGWKCMHILELNLKQEAV